MKTPKEKVIEVPTLMAEWDTEANEAEGIFPDKLGSQSNTYAYWTCKYGHKWKAKINNRYNGRGCPECRKGLQTSFPEQAVFFYVQNKFPDAINGYKDIFGNGMELDIYIPSIKTGIEYDGYAWHGDNALERERRKYDICKSKGITLIRLKENSDHFINDLKVADYMVLVRKPFAANRRGYHWLDYAIRDLLKMLGDYDYSSYFTFNPELRFRESMFGPAVFTDVNTYRDKRLILEKYLITLENNSFGSKYPELVKKWHPTKNGNLTPYMFSPQSNVKVWWKGACGHEWENTFSVMSRGTDCPYCSGQKVLKGFNDLETRFPDIAAQWHPTLNGNKTPDMYTFGSGHKTHWLCPVCGQVWTSAINNRTTNGHGCPYCAGERPIKGVNDLPTLRPDLMAEWDYDANIGIDPTEMMPQSNKKVGWKCAKCGYKYKALITNRAKGTGCKNCAGQIIHPGINDLETLYPEIAAEWDYEANKGVLPSQVFPSSNKRFHWKCEYGHTWTAQPNRRTTGTGCPYCSGNKVWIGFNDLATTNPEIANDWHPTKNGNLKPTDISKGYTKKVWFLCPTCGNVYDSYIGNKIKGFGKCPYCSPRKTRASVVVQVETGKCFPTLKEAAISVGSEDYRQIHMCCKGKCQTAFGYHWEYRDKTE